MYTGVTWRDLATWLAAGAGLSWLVAAAALSFVH
jgi:hypothetical protein